MGLGIRGSTGLRQPPQFSFIQRVNHLEKREAVEVGVASANPANAMFTHEDCSMGVMQHVAGQIRKLGKDLCGHLDMPRAGNEHTNSRRVEQARNEFP